jgi:type III restriction enzyme
MLNSNAKYINNRLALRPPQKESLERFQQICDILSLSKEPDLESELQKIKELFAELL